MNRGPRPVCSLLRANPCNIQYEIKDLCPSAGQRKWSKKWWICGLDF
ncbi:hypothetical protein C943_04546 [Mariniradius saccharolyticus AK6]|uniref:Uncharacterized protein n=1 Tax=Mariniradius saccharolyticus AK6 TaxID=1239962 RepID=M7XYV4_9BACT|nr:hypothetical protein C943_04546 [Mariniradius saccharolyticus AK6]